MNTIELVSSREMAYYMTVYDWDLFSCVQEVSDCKLSIGSLTLAGWTTTRVSEYNRVGEFKRDGLLHDSV